jgi:hypothetical protein
MTPENYRDLNVLAEIENLNKAQIIFEKKQNPTVASTFS